MSWLTNDEMAAQDAPTRLFRAWFKEAQVSEINDANGMALATADAAGLPDCRMVLMKEFDDDGIVFYTNEESAKGRQLAQNAQAAILFHWKSLRRQIRMRGAVEWVSEAESDAYFSSRPRDSRIGAWASKQSRPLESRFALEKAVASYAAQYAVGEVPRPAYWHGYRVRPLYWEFWMDKPFRLHDRVVWRRDSLDQPFATTRLYP